MAIDNFVPEFWSARLLRFLQPRLVLAQPRIVNHNWEGEIAEAGDTVHIQRIAVSASLVRDYAKDTAMSAPDRASDTTTALVIDQMKAFYIALDDVDKAQANVGVMSQFMERAARQMAVTLDSYAASQFIAGALPANTLGSVATPDTIALSAGTFTPYEFCVEARRLLQKQSTPGDDRWMVINSDLEALFLKDPVFITGGSGAAEVLGDGAVRNGVIGRIAGFDILTTEAVPSETNGHAVIFGDGNYSQTWADQIIKVEAERLQGEFGDAVKGLHVFGSKVVENESYGVAHVTT